MINVDVVTIQILVVNFLQVLTNVKKIFIIVCVKIGNVVNQNYIYACVILIKITRNLIIIKDVDVIKQIVYQTFIVYVKLIMHIVLKINTYVFVKINHKNQKEMKLNVCKIYINVYVIICINLKQKMEYLLNINFKKNVKHKFIALVFMTMVKDMDIKVK